MTQTKIRQPIVTVCGHVDHGKTSLLDALRGSSVHEREAGGITQKISFTLFPSEQLKKSCPLIDKKGIKIDIPGFLFIDTPGHAAFTNLRKRGGSLADLAILVIDINEGIKPQTAETIQILKINKVPFVIALNKIDRISGWKKLGDEMQKNIELQPKNTKQEFDEKYMTLIGSLNSFGFDSDLFFNIPDFAKKIALVPISAKTKEGIPELLMMLCGLSQKYLAGGLSISKSAKGVILEIKKDKSISYAEAILYDGELEKNDEIAIAGFGEPTITKIRVLEEIEPLSFKFKPKEKAVASTGLKIQFSDKVDVLSGMPFVSYSGDKEQIANEFKQEISETFDSMLSKQGIIAKADSFGGLEALLILLKESGIPVVKATIGDISKTDIISAKANKKINEVDAVIAGFNVPIDAEAKEILGSDKSIKILTEEVIYKLIENLQKFREEKKKEIEKNRMMSLNSLCKLKILPQYVFRNTKPAIFGVKIEAGKIIQNISLIDESGEKVGRIKNMQSENKPVSSAEEGMEVAISVPGLNFERGLKEKKFLYSEISESQFKNFRKNKDLLSSSEISALQEISDIKKRKKSDWGN
ncbi:translation initiation factor IF-2 [Candidatus Pacearchaeota archaeon]|nr:translation initiation factor IF-2 [Candidatus Pacearchaeota archaeon]